MKTGGFYDGTAGYRPRFRAGQAELDAGIAELSGHLGRAPNCSELAEALGMEREDLLEALVSEDFNFKAPAPTAEIRGGAGRRAMFSLDDLVDRYLKMMGISDELKATIAALPELELTVMLLRFVSSLTHTEIAEEIGITRIHVSRLLARSLAGLRESLP